MTYRLKDGIFFVRGALRGAILDTVSGNVFSINESACDVITYQSYDEGFWEKLMELGLAEFGEPISKELPSLSVQEAVAKLKFVWFEIVTHNCNERCIHCYANSMPKNYRADLSQFNELGSNNLQNDRMSYQDWIRVISESYELGCRNCQFIGGEPFLYRGEKGETVLDLAEYAAQLGYEFIEIYTNGTLLTDKKIKQIKKLGLHIATSLYSNQSHIHDLITQTPGSHKLTINAIRKLKEADVPTRVEIILMEQNQKTINETLDFRNNLGVSGKKPDIIRPQGRAIDDSFAPDFKYYLQYAYKLNPNFTVDKKKLAHYTTAHPCLLGKITITEDGDVFPCIFSRDQLLGNVLESPDLLSIIQDSTTQTVWLITKDNVQICKDCEYRYVCFDCRPLAASASGDNADFHSAPPPYCTYNPYTGEWAAGTWKTSESGEPYYDRNFKVMLEKLSPLQSTEH